MKNNTFKTKNKGPRTNSNKFNDTFQESYAVTTKWFEKNCEDCKNFDSVSEETLIELKNEAKQCHNSEVANYNTKNSKTNPNFQWIKTVMSKGTSSDKVAAHVLAIQDNPICSLDTLRNFVGMVKVGKKQDCITIIESLTELFLTDLLRPDQKLKTLHQKPLSVLNELSSGNAITRRKLLSTWYFEEQLKEIYATFVVALNNVAHDTIENYKEKAISAMCKLLVGNPEQEKNLLENIVNKLGDPSQKIVSKTIYNLGRLLFKHPNMQTVVLHQVEKLLFRPNISNKAQYYGLCFLSQFYLCHEDCGVARKLIEVYFAFFNACIKKGEVDSRMMSALLMGVNRAYPYAELEIDKISHHIDTIYRVVHIANFNISLHALNLLYQISDSQNGMADRFFAALYKKLGDCKLFNSTHHAMLLSLVYKALLKDTEISRVKVFIKRLLQAALFSQPFLACGILYLISQLMSKKENLQSFLFKQSPSSLIEMDENDEEEKYHDIKDDANVIEINDEIEIKQETIDDIEDLSVKEIKPDIDNLNKSTGSWYHAKNLTNNYSKQNFDYNPFCRNPLYGGGEFCVFTEMYDLKNHFHPTVALYATNILNGELIKYSGDPLKDFTLIRFLDRFVFKNPKKIDDLNKGAHPTFGKRKNYKPAGLKSIPVNSVNYLNETETNIPVDELFLYNYLQEKYKNKEIKDDNDDDSDLESVQSDEFEDMLNKMTGKIEESDDDLDFMNDIQDSFKTKNSKKKNRKLDEGESEEENDDDEEEIDEFDEDNEEEEEFSDFDDEDEDMVFIDTDEENNKNKKKIQKNIKSLFASADEFSSLLEDEGSSKFAPGSSGVMSNKDNASNKQIAWEAKRNNWLQGYSNALGKGKGSKRANNSKYFIKSKKLKK